MQQREDKLWKVEIAVQEDFYEFYLISRQKPVFVAESGMGKFRRMFSFFNQSYSVPELPPIFYIAKNQEAAAEKTDEMHGFTLQELTSKHIVLSIENPQEKPLYEISLFSKKVQNLFKKKYILAQDKKEAIKYSKRFKDIYRPKVSKARKMDCYPLVRVNREEIILSRKIKSL
ncbi:hypothetical protein IBX65_04565 [Candidatus Aerophobetes bacterium]|nr:hypothetical protein [Candidatus Aerophobetes bacterium]